mmetsp:Transcript_16419/g.45170  ORF Transcript_16419/g.45170 Transcript_16419/m.45170 type:complete len:86 (+) Transcript_16419:351-608(+)
MPRRASVPGPSPRQQQQQQQLQMALRQRQMARRRRAPMLQQQQQQQQTCPRVGRRPPTPIRAKCTTTTPKGKRDGSVPPQAAVEF